MTLPVEMSIPIVAGIAISLLIAYMLSVKTVFAVFLWKELGKGYETTEHPEHEKWAQERGVECARMVAGQRLAASSFWFTYCSPYFFLTGEFDEI